MLRWTVAGSVGVLAGPLLIAAGLPWRLVIAVFALATAAPGRAGAGRRRASTPSRREEPVRDVARRRAALRRRCAGSSCSSSRTSRATSSPGSSRSTSSTPPVPTRGSLRSPSPSGPPPTSPATSCSSGCSSASTACVSSASPRLPWPSCCRRSCSCREPRRSSRVLAALAAARSCWYPLSQARLYAALPGRSGAVTALSTLASPIGLALPVAVRAARLAPLGIGNALWAVLAAPLALLIGTARTRG